VTPPLAPPRDTPTPTKASSPTPPEEEEEEEDLLDICSNDSNDKASTSRKHSSSSSSTTSSSVGAELPVVSVEIYYDDKTRVLFQTCAQELKKNDAFCFRIKTREGAEECGACGLAAKPTEHVVLHSHSILLKR